MVSQLLPDQAINVIQNGTPGFKVGLQRVGKRRETQTKRMRMEQPCCRSPTAVREKFGARTLRHHPQTNDGTVESNLWAAQRGKARQTPV
mgnify:CR=1 FL=1